MNLDEYEIIDLEKNGYKYENCLKFLGCNLESSLEEIREKFYYSLNYMSRFQKAIQNHYKIDSSFYENTDIYTRKYEEEIRNRKLMRIFTDCYFAALLKSFNFYYNINNNDLRYILDDQLKTNSKEYEMDSNDYLQYLGFVNYGGTHQGLYKYTPNLINIILIERKKLDPSKKVKVLKYINEPKYEDIDKDLFGSYTSE